MLVADGGLDPKIEAALERLDELVEAFEMDPDEGIQEMATELLDSMDTIHRAGVTRLAALLSEAGPNVLRRALDDPPVRLLFKLYDLLPAPDPGFVPLDEIAGPAEGPA